MLGKSPPSSSDLFHWAGHRAGPRCRSGGLPPLRGRRGELSESGARGQRRCRGLGTCTRCPANARQIRRYEQSVILSGQQDRHRRWVAVRVELGAAQLSNPIGPGRAQATPSSNWPSSKTRGPPGSARRRPPSNLTCSIDGRHHTSEQFHTPYELQHRVRVDDDSTADELTEIASSVGTHLPVSDPGLRRLLQEIGTLNASTKTAQLTGIIDDIRLIEFVTGQNRQPPSGWPKFLDTNLSTWHARHRIFDEIWQSVWDVLQTFIFPMRPT